MTEKPSMTRADRRGWGAAADRNKPDKIVPRYGISPQLIPNAKACSDANAPPRIVK